MDNENENRIWINLDWKELIKIGAFVDPWPLGAIPANIGEYKNGIKQQKSNRPIGSNDSHGDGEPCS
jgi:hypothetical protein